MLRFIPDYMSPFVVRPWLMFSPTMDTDLDALDCRCKWRGRRTSQSLTPAVYDDDPLDTTGVDSTEPTKKEKSPKKQGPGKKQTLPTPNDVPPPTPTDVPAPEPWDIPPPDPKDPRPKSIP